MAHPYAGIAANADIKTVDNAVIDSYEACVEFARTHKAVETSSIHAEWQLGSNVRLRLTTRGDSGETYYAVVLYHTEIVRYYKENDFSVDNGGYNTPTSRQRITQFTPQGYWFFHDKKQLVGHGHAALDHSIRFPVDRSTSGVGYPD